MSRKTKDNRPATKRYFRPEIRPCPVCQSRLRRRWNVWRKYVVTLSGRIHAFQQGYSCSNAQCTQPNKVYTSVEADRLVLKGRSFGRDVIVQIGYWRFWEHATIDEILERLHLRKIPISRQEVLNLLGDFLALLRAAQPAKVATYNAFFQQHGMIIGLDGMQPEKGDNCLYIVREEQVGIVLVAEHLSESSVQALNDKVLAPVASLGFRVRGIVSDAQDEIRAAVTQRFPGIPHQNCHFHCLRDAGKPTFEADRALKTDLKKALRPKLRGFNQRLKRCPIDDPCHAVLADYATCLRSTLLIDGVAPFDLGGLSIFEALQTLEDSLQRCRKKGAIHSWKDCWVHWPYGNPSPISTAGSRVNSVG